jgi:dienelactone hydrolase
VGACTHFSLGGSQTHSLYEVVHDTVRIESDGASLAGTLSRPDVPGRVPAVVILHAAGLERRSDYRVYADSLAARGVAVLAYDMRGTAASTGNPVLPTFGALASDATAMARYLRSRPDIDPRAVGVWALSRGAFTAPLVASRDSATAFVVIVSGPAIPVAALEAAGIADALRARGRPDGDVREALALYLLGVEVARTGEGRDSLERVFAKAQSARWFPDFPIKTLPPEGHWSWQHFRDIVTFDPDTIWSRIRVPVLAIYGGRDRPIIAADSRVRLERTLRTGGNGMLTISLLREADHLMQGPTGGYVGELFEMQAQWIRRQAAVRGSMR